MRGKNKEIERNGWRRRYLNNLINSYGNRVEGFRVTLCFNSRVIFSRVDIARCDKREMGSRSSIMCIDISKSYMI